MSMTPEERANELRSLFFETAREQLLHLNEAGLRLESSPGDAEVVKEIRRAVHTLKGDSAACGFKELSDTAHALEDVLTPELAVKAGLAMAELVLSAADAFDALLTAYRDRITPPATDALRELIQRVVSGAGSDVSVAVPRFDWNEYERLLIASNVVPGQPIYHAALIIDPQCAMRAAALQLIRKTLSECGTVLVTRPAEDSTTVPEMVEVAICSPHPPEWIELKCKVPGIVSQVHLDAVPAATAAAAKPTDAAQAEQPGESAAAAAERRQGQDRRAAQNAGESFLRVESERIDTVLDLVGELIIARSMLQQSLREVTHRLGRDTLSTRLADVVAFHSMTLDKLQRSVMKIRMVPVEQTFRLLPRVVRDIARQLGRQVRVVIEGQNTDLDKSILDILSEPIMHLVRNAVDHGIEPPEVRVARGKPAEGTLRLSAYHQGNQVVIEISDDGAGVDRERVVQKAVAKGIITEQAAAKLSESDALSLIFQSGLSTREQATKFSGRGVGMDVVKAVMDQVKGAVTVSSVRGVGTTLKLRVPLTLAIIKALLFRVGERLYAVPLLAVTELVRVRQSDVHALEQQEVLHLRNEVLPLVRLHRVSGCTAPNGRGFFVVVVTVAERKYGLVVDRTVGERELVIKALDNSLLTTDLVSGASVLGDGKVALILNLHAVVERLGSGSDIAAREGVPA